MKIEGEFKIISSFINHGDLVLDLGCADGDLLYYLKREKNVQARGIEQNMGSVIKCLGKGIPVYQGDIQDGLNFYKRNFFDVVILTKTIQELLQPKETITAMLNIAKKAIISFLNYGYYENRIAFLLKGMNPKNLISSFNWYDSPEIHPLTIKDFEKFCLEHQLKILQKYFLKENWQTKNAFLPNLFCKYAIYLVSK